MNKTNSTTSLLPFMKTTLTALQLPVRPWQPTSHQPKRNQQPQNKTLLRIFIQPPLHTSPSFTFYTYLGTHFKSSCNNTQVHPTPHMTSPLYIPRTSPTSS